MVKIYTKLDRSVPIDSMRSIEITDDKKKKNEQVVGRVYDTCDCNASSMKGLVL